MALFNWTPDGAVGTSFKRMGRYMPPPPPFAAPPLLWGDEQHVRTLFAGSGVDLVFDREMAPNPLARFARIDARIDYYTSAFGPLMQLRRMTEANGSWPALRGDLAELYAQTDGGGEYLIVLGRKTELCER
jgi:hypothetical protein